MDLAKQSDIMSRFVQVVVSSQPLAENNSRTFIACIPTGVALWPSVPSDIPSDHPTSIFHLHLQPHRCFCLSSLHQSFGTRQAPDNSPRFDSCIWSLLRRRIWPKSKLATMLYHFSHLCMSHPSQRFDVATIRESEPQSRTYVLFFVPFDITCTVMTPPLTSSCTNAVSQPEPDPRLAHILVCTFVP